MSTKDKIKQILSEMQKIRYKNKIECAQLDNYLYYQHSKIIDKEPFLMACGICEKPRADANPSFKRAFKTMSDLERAEFYLLNVKNVNKIIKLENLNVGNSSSQASSYKRKHLKEPKKVKIIIKASNIYKSWTNVNAELLQNQKIIRICDSKIEIDLHYYILRKSKSKSVTGIVLEATQTGPLGNTVRVCYTGLDFQQIFNTVYQLWEEAQYQYVENIIVTQVKKRKRKTESIKLMRPQSMMKQQTTGSNKLTIRTGYSIQKTLPKLQRAQSQCLTYALQVIPTFTSFINFNQLNYGQYHQKNGLKVRKILQFDRMGLSAEYFQRMISDLNHIKKRKQTISSIKILEQDKDLQIQLVKQFNFFGEQDVLFVYERHAFVHYGVIYVIQKSIDNQQYGLKLDSIVQANIQHCIWRIRQKGDKIQLFVQAKVSYSKDPKNWKKAQKYSGLFIGDMSKFIDEIKNCQQIKNSLPHIIQSIQSKQFQQSQISSISEQQQFFTMPGSMVSGAQSIIDEANIKMNDRKLSISEANINQSEEQSQTNCETLLQHKFILEPQIKQDKILAKSNKGHWLWEDEWEIRPNGDLVNVNQQKINAQSSVLKLVIKRIGKNLLTGKSILSMSLPIQIFGVDSNLQRLAKGYMFAPIFLEKAVSSNNGVDRMKNVVCFGLGFTLAYIKMEKPFNPILGETYQGLIDGCPVYGQQISHHPPISSLLMVGRGYRVVGSFEAKVQMGMNSASGINEGFNHVIFQQSKDVLKITTPPGEISGLVYGERKLSLIKKTYCLDEANSLICEIEWGKNKSSKDEYGKFNDYFGGRIIKLKQGIEMNNYKNIKQSQIEQQYGRIYGRFTQKVMFNDQILFDVQEESPYLVQDYVPCLQSDVRFRKDVIYRKQVNFSLAQQAKEQLQEIQRRDRKLRAQYHT